jgi:hypothetical protein
MTTARGAFTVEGYEEQVKQLKSMMSDDPTFRRRVKAVSAQVLKQARNDTSQEARTAVENDPRGAYKAVRSAVYRRILGGQVNILQKRKAGTPTNYQKPLKGLPKRGGNRWGRSERTKQLEGYQGSDRGFVLRFLNAGTSDRFIRSYTDRSGQRHDLGSASTQNIKTRALEAFRGNISARNWFGSASQKALENASLQMQELIDRIIAQEFV